MTIIGYEYTDEAAINECDACEVTEGAGTDGESDSDSCIETYSSEDDGKADDDEDENDNTGSW
jgi:hypothetical protein